VSFSLVMVVVKREIVPHTNHQNFLLVEQNDRMEME
jgi:hypothetical protein